MLASTICSCRTIYAPTNGNHSRDSVRVEHRIDSVVQVIHDSVTVQMPCNDSIEVAYIDRWRTEYRDRKVAVHDTIVKHTIDTIYTPVEVIREVEVHGFFYRSGVTIWCIAAFMILLLMVVFTIKAIR